MVRLTIFKEPGELSELRESLYGDMMQQKRGLAKAKAYQVRGNLPPSVHATCLLVSAMHSDVPGADFYAIRQVYAMSLIRFVNEISDSQQLGRNVVPSHILADQTQLPNSFVELRHAATHEDSPSVYLLRQMAHRAMDWLMDNFWSLQSEPMSSKKLKEKPDPKRLKTNENITVPFRAKDTTETEDDAGNDIKELSREWRRLKRTDTSATVPPESSTALKAEWENDEAEFLDVCINRNVLVPSGSGSFTKKTMSQVIALWSPLFQMSGHEVCQESESALITAISPREWPLKKNENREFSMLESWAVRLAPYLNDRSARQSKRTPRPWNAQILAIAACDTGDFALYKVAEEMASLVGAEIIEFASDKTHIPGWKLLAQWTPKPLGT